MNECADLEISLHKREPSRYAVEMRFTLPRTDADIRLIRDGAALIQFDFAHLRTLLADPIAQGAYLTQCLFSDPELKAAWAQARAGSETNDVPLRLRLFIGPTALDLHALNWETLRDPLDGTPLVTSERIRFSRYLSSADWKPVERRPRTSLRAVVLIANPINLDELRLAPIDVLTELRRVRTALSNAMVTALVTHGKATLDRLIAELRNDYDIVYIVCHGALIKGEARLYLEEADGKVAVTKGRELAMRLKELEHRPRLVVLASCQSAGGGDEARSGDNGALAAVGPLLAEIGVPAVIAMQGNITMQTVAQFMPQFFQALEQYGEVDRAMAIARGAVRTRFDAWMPVLFMRLQRGRIWYVPGFGEDKSFSKWPTLVRSIAGGRCTPILGFGLVESLIGSSREIAQQWAATYHYPMEPQDREDLPQVTQFLAVNQDRLFPRTELDVYARREIWRRYGAQLAPELADASLNTLIEAVAVLRQDRHPNDPHSVLAQLPFPLYITTNFDNMLQVALKRAGKEPQTLVCPWNEYVEEIQAESQEPPSVERPLVYHLFGNLLEPISLVLTEDDYFDYMIGVTRNSQYIPAMVKRAMTDTALLFLGFQLNDWNFRVFFRSIINMEGRRRSNLYTNVGVQLDPEEGRTLEPEGARRYLESYFRTTSVNIYWGRVDDFIAELEQQFTVLSAPMRAQQ